MKRLEDMSPVELCDICDVDRSDLINFEAMNREIQFPGFAPDFTEVPKPTVAYEDLYILNPGMPNSLNDKTLPIGFRTLEDATTVRSLIYRVLDDAKSTAPKIVVPTTQPEISIRSCICPSDAQMIKNWEAENQKLSTARYDWDRKSEPWKKLVGEIDGAITKARAAKRDAQKILDTRTEYRQMCNGDDAVALGFLKKIHGEDAELKIKAFFPDEVPDEF